MPKFIALWIKENKVPCYHLDPVEVENYQILLDDARKNDITVTAIFDVTGENPVEVYRRPIPQEADVIMEKVSVSIELEALHEIIKLLKSSLEPMVHYKRNRDPLELSEAAHDVKNANIGKALSLLPAEIVAQVDVG